MSERRICDLYLCQATRAFDGLYSYWEPDDGTKVKAGMLVEIPFGRGNSLRQAYVRRVRSADQEPDIKLKAITQVLSESMLREDQFVLAEEIKRRYYCSMAQALQTMVPARVSLTGSKKERFVRLVDEREAMEVLEEGSLRSLGQMRILQYLLDAGEASVQDIKAALQLSTAVINGLKKHGLIEFYQEAVKRDEEEIPSLEEEKTLSLNAEQELAFQSIRDSLKNIGKGQLKEFLLYGVTGSGKTEVYLRAAEECLNSGKDVLILVPEISLTPLICNRIVNRFGETAAVLHSRLSVGRRFDQWQSIIKGEKHLVVGARSAIFAPLENIGLIIMDEEQESSYKSEMTPKYDTAELARVRAILHDATLLLASATPSVESFHRVEEGRSSLLKLTKRAGKGQLPKTDIINMRDELLAGNRSIISRELAAELKGCFSRGEQAMIFLNRRGLSSFLLCRDCGEILKCTDCDVSLKEHLNFYAKQKRTSQMICHLCGKVSDRPQLCPSCGSDKIAPFGLGTQQAEEILSKAYPEQRFLRMDQDTTSRLNGHAKILESFAKGEADCLIGTQMIAKGHDFPKVTVVGILSADLMFSLDGYTADERAFQLVCQAAGRAGRGKDPGRVLVQSFHPENRVLQAACAQNYDLFYQEEIKRRELLGYPPFATLAVIVISSFSDEAAKKAADKLYQFILLRLPKDPDFKVQIFEVQRAPVNRIRKKWRYRILLKCKDKELAVRILERVVDLPSMDGVNISADLDPTYLL